MNIFRQNNLFPNFSDSVLTDENIKTICASICRNISLHHGLYTMSHKKHDALPNCRENQLFIDFYKKYKEFPFYKETKTEIEKHSVNLSTAGILTFPWDVDRLKGCFESGIQENPNPLKYSLTLIKPFDIYIVTTCGNHSIFYGMFFSGGTVYCDYAIDYTPIIKDLILTKKYFISNTNQKFKKSFFTKMYPETELLFELGKKLIK